MQPEHLTVYGIPNHFTHDISRLVSHVHSDGIPGLEVETQDHAGTAFLGFT
jgi:hypothetical protein